MPEYGLTPTGINIKRLDVILDEMHSTLTEKLGINTRRNPKSYLNVFLTDIADSIAELWEFGEGVYHAMYPFSAENTSLDHSAEFGGIMREGNQKSYYQIYCECSDGTTIPKGTIIKSDTNPEIRFTASADTVVSRSAFSSAIVRVVTVAPDKIFTIAVDGLLYSVSSNASSTAESITEALAALIPPTTLTVSVGGGALTLSVLDIKKPSVMTLSETLTTQSVTGIVLFESEDYGDISLPDGAINQLVSTIPGLLTVQNLGGYIAGRLRETDVELRKSYVDKIFARSSRMTESIKSAILDNIQGVETCAVFENQYDFPDADGRPPHSVEVVADGGSDIEIAQQILNTKAGGIQTFGDVLVTLIGEFGEQIPIRFNRPQYLFIWFKVIVSIGTSLPPDYVDVIKKTIIEQVNSSEVGRQVVPQKLIGKIYEALPDIEYMQIPVFYTADGTEQPDEYRDVIVPVSVRQRPYTEATRIEVVLSGSP